MTPEELAALSKQITETIQDPAILAGFEKLKAEADPTKAKKLEDDLKAKDAELAKERTDKAGLLVTMDTVKLASEYPLLDIEALGPGTYDERKIRADKMITKLASHKPQGNPGNPPNPNPAVNPDDPNRWAGAPPMGGSRDIKNQVDNQALEESKKKAVEAGDHMGVLDAIFHPSNAGKLFRR